jgi:hypothetical protein
VLHSRGSRLVSASPLAGRSQPLPFEIDDQIFSIDGDDPASHMDSGAAITGFGDQLDQPLGGFLKKDIRNFLGHIQEAILAKQTDEEQRAAQLGGEANAIAELTFQELIDPATNSYQVAAAAMLHVLTLANRNIVTVEQNREDDDYAPIIIRVI